LLAALALWFIFGLISSFFRGPIAGWNELGGPVYVQDQGPLHVATGVMYLLTAGVAVVAVRRRVSTTLIAGFAVGALILGATMFAGM